MPRLPRISVPNVTFHVVQRGNDRGRTFFDERDFRTYVLLLSRISRRYQTSVHAYVLMTNHVHLLMTSQRQDGISLTMQQLGSSFVRHINERYSRTGTLWEGRFRSSPVDSDYYCLACYRYIELNPVRAGIVAAPDDYRWSSYRENVGLRALSVVTPHASYLRIASEDERRREQYRQIVNERLPESTLATLRDSTVKGLPIGDERFLGMLERKTGRTIIPGPRGRPRAAKAESSRSAKSRQSSRGLPEVPKKGL